MLLMVRAEMTAGEASADMIGRTETVLAEVLNNVVEHALRLKGDDLIEIRGEEQEGGWKFFAVDSGAPLPDGQLPGKTFPPLDTAMEDLPEGGFGWAMVHVLTRDLSYRRVCGKNQLQFFVPSE